MDEHTAVLENIRRADAGAARRPVHEHVRYSGACWQQYFDARLSVYHATADEKN